MSEKKKNFALLIRNGLTSAASVSSEGQKYQNHSRWTELFSNFLQSDCSLQSVSRFLLLFCCLFHLKTVVVTFYRWFENVTYTGKKRVENVISNLFEITTQSLQSIGYIYEKYQLYKFITFVLQNVCMCIIIYFLFLSVIWAPRHRPNPPNPFN